jgi:rubredoxin
MLRQLVVTTLLAVGTEAAYSPSPIWWGAKNYVTLAPNWPAAPQMLTIGEVPDATSANVVPEFEAKADKTIAWEERGWCVEAFGSENGDAVRVNQCTGAPSQRWTFLPQSHNRNMIQLEGTQKCMDVDPKSALKGAQIVLQDCEYAHWQFEAAIPTAMSSMRYVMVSLSALTFLGALSLSSWLWQRKGRSTTLRQSMDLGGLSLTATPAVGRDATTFNPKITMDAQRMAPAVMAVSTMPAADTQISKEMRSLAEEFKAHVAQAENLEEAKRIAKKMMPTVTTDFDFQEQVKSVSAQIDVSGAAADLAKIQQALHTKAPEKSLQGEEQDPLSEQMKVVFENPVFFQETTRICKGMMERISNPSFQQEASQIAEEMASLNSVEDFDPEMVALGLAALAALQPESASSNSKPPSAPCTHALAIMFALSAHPAIQPGASGAAALGVPNVQRRSAPVEMQFGKKKKTVAEQLEEKGYWPGEWLCADCGYIYEPGTVPPFEELRPKWKCPQCAGPRRRFVKKAGDMVGQLDDSGLIYGSLAAGVLIFGLVYVGLTI